MQAKLFEADLRWMIYLFGFFSVWSIRSTPSTVEEFRGFRPLFLGSFGSFSFFSLNQFCNLNSIVLFLLNVRNFYIFREEKKQHLPFCSLFRFFWSFRFLRSFGLLELAGSPFLLSHRVLIVKILFIRVLINKKKSVSGCEHQQNRCIGSETVDAKKCNYCR